MYFLRRRFSAGIALFFLGVLQATAQEFTGGVSGTILDASTLDPLPGVNIIVVESPSIGTSTDPEGTFTIEPLEVGTYSLRVSCIGYGTQVVTNVVIVTGRQTPVKVKLPEAVIEGEEVTVEASYFTRMLDVSPLSVNGLDRAEVRRAPGAIQDVQRAVQSLPGVASSTDNINELIVRGGAPFENLTVMDHMEIPSINHYSNQLNSAGPINMVNADMIEDVQFFAGGFPVQYGDKSSSVMNLTVREGNRSTALSSNTGFTFAGMGTLLEGGFAGGSGSFIVSARNSLLEILDKIVGLSSLSLTAVPRYWDAQGKAVYDLSPRQKLKFNLLYGDSRINIEGDPDEKDELRRNVIDSSSVERAYPTNRQIVGGVSLQTLWGKDGYSVATLYGVGSFLDVDVSEDFFHRQRGPEGEVLTATKINSRPVFTNIGRESFLAAKFETFYQAHPRHELMFGAQVQTALHWRNQVWVEGDTSRFDLDRDGVFETGPVIVPQWNYTQTIPFGGASKYYVYASDRYLLSPELSLTLGVRYDHFTYSGAGNLSPRAALSYRFSSSGSRVSLALGRYPQSQPFPFLGDRQNLGYNRNLENMVADHAVLGIDHILGTGLKLSLEGYYKRYRNVAVSEDFIYSADETFWSDRYL
ncbi:MAG: TonB-dependent receptor, partial [Ignavibacteria bacterium]|nr:TonB-dependent receptor [Ignavibacteria bacterium]